ncbi:hypothetical protein HMPREF9607_01068 [Cutibacterium modestum HL044PA1]|uniref:Uncharacterized protein n=1 Tax=Cutibacterium modestum HL044PA1 TaxID=765109 RepID=A0ABN0C6J4_9ACTN|nr:hypothetical protein HMPREF9607_01068 [Cutibacterium modestum HL044PA1]
MTDQDTPQISRHRIVQAMTMTCSTTRAGIPTPLTQANFVATKTCCRFSRRYGWSRGFGILWHWALLHH